MGAYVLNHHEPLYRELYPVIEPRIDGLPYSPYIYPPFFASLLRPLATIAIRPAQTLWLWINLGLLIVGWRWLLRLITLSLGQAYLLLGFLILFPPLYETLILGQVNLILFGLVLGCLLLLRRPSTSAWVDILAGSLIGIAGVIKIYPLAFGLIFIIHRRYRAIAGVIGGIMAAIGVGIWLGGGWQNTIIFFTEIMPNLRHLSNIIDQSIWPFSKRLFQEHNYIYQYHNQVIYLTLKPLINAPLLAPIVAVILASTIGIPSIKYFFARWRGDSNADLLWFDLGLIISLTLLCFPVVHNHYLFLLVIPMAWLMNHARSLASNQRQWLWLGLLMSLLPLVIERFWRFLLDQAPTPIFLSFGFISNVILWALLIYYRPIKPISAQPYHQQA
ncbi:glycosyltransferase family 87 protein [Herpetosiphon llansteffanensis]|uniref:glycosyltransferase family 87 protein n=1 Tax=Herpetosiphon llansteffanensis TaxID=2094568 RepID=UPI001F0C4F11|nr:glycosyltransferase family 87 protein [Herpetosiphon llansteffanensis]